MSRTVHQTANLPASPKALYSMYLDPDQHASFTGAGPARIAAAAGTEWSAFDGRIYGRVLSLVQDRLIVQSWRPLVNGWPSRYWDPWRSFLQSANKGVRQHQ